MQQQDFFWELLAVQRLALDDDAAPGGPRERELLVRQAAIMDRMAEDDSTRVEYAVDHIHDAAEYALLLLAYDREHRTTRGPVPADDLRWGGDPRGYSRQEHRAWVLSEM